MPLAQPETFTFTNEEAAAVQGFQMRRQSAVARKGPVLRYSSLAAPFIIAGAIYICGLIWFGGAMPGWLFVTLMATFVAGMFAQTGAYWLNLVAAKKRLRETTRQTFEPRTVRLVNEGLEQSIPAARTLQMWTGVDAVALEKDMILIWAGNLLVMAIPVRAFPGEMDARAFLEECQSLASAGGD